MLYSKLFECFALQSIITCNDVTNRIRILVHVHYIFIHVYIAVQIINTTILKWSTTVSGRIITHFKLLFGNEIADRTKAVFTFLLTRYLYASLSHLYKCAYIPYSSVLVLNVNKTSTRNLNARVKAWSGENT